MNLNFARQNAWLLMPRTLLLTAWLPLLGWAAFVTYTAFFVVPLGNHAHGPGVKIGLPPRFAIFTYSAWTVVLGWLSIKLHRGPTTLASRSINEAK